MEGFSCRSGSGRRGLRRRQSNRLPSIDSLSISGNGDGKKTPQVLRVLRRIAKTHRAKNSRPFYSIRSVAKHFALPPTTVTRMYGQLKEEGLLTSAWGSKTFVEPYCLDRELRVRGVVALPVLLSSFCHLRNHRAFFLSMRDALWRLGFATHLLFYEAAEAAQYAFAELLLSCKADAVICFMPDPESRNYAACLTDRRVRVVTIGDCTPIHTRHHYYLSRSRALDEALRIWKNEGVDSLRVISHQPGDANGRMAVIQECLRACKIPHVVTYATSRQCRKLPLPEKRRGIIFLGSEAVLQLASQRQAEMARWSDQTHILLMEGAVDFVGGVTLFAKADSIEFDWPQVARRIACDFAGSLAIPATRRTFEANWRRQPG